ncbi:wobble nucleotide-excising tRNase [Vreelandella songnenensis]|uniref:Wobble nucleotide-excising tRNase n=1 Tax=Vreelandella songnenensis TaxID=1176243 RepID=A0A2T0V7X8_9GAMM|nr:AAA family ATPase [Halomonas songnenensis]PRY66295.1 wobble nucleotide-excising tRNase [Halomonas songnenensis]
MITELHIENVTSYKKSSKLSPVNKVCLIYGLNGTGKSTISNYLYNPSLKEYKDCRLNKKYECEILVYNQQFLNDYFFEEDGLKGIFTLSKENKNILQKIKQETTKLEKLEEDKETIDEKLVDIQARLNSQKENATNNVWKIKTNYSGGDRVLEYCLDGLKRTEKLFDHIKSIALPSQKPEDTIEKLKNEVSSIQGDNAVRIPRLNEFSFSGSNIEKNDLFEKIIVGSQEGSVAEFINKLGNIDWVRTGLGYIPEEVYENAAECPFCQENTVTQELLNSIKNVFDLSYENDVAALKKLKASYQEAAEELVFGNIDDLIVTTSEISKQWRLAVEQLKSIHIENTLLIENKLNNPSTPIELKSSDNAIFQINDAISKLDSLIVSHNNKLENKSNSLNEIKARFWRLMRWEYDQTLSTYEAEKIKLQREESGIMTDQSNKVVEISTANRNISTFRKQTVNIEEAIDNINNALLEIGVVGFSVVKYGENLYRVARSDTDSDAFHSLSEGEKTVISFLYFIELCKGEKAAESSPKKKVVAIDDPISSLSHLYIFNIGQLIKKIFFNSNLCEQVIVLTHSLYFFYELTHTNKEKRNATQNLYRIIKNSSGSSIVSMKYEEIQNDYQTYWSMIKDESTPPALIANCMRNIIEYFFSFVQKKDFNDVFQKPALSADRFKAFYRYMNRESHSLGQNIFDIKEFDYEVFKDGLRLIFDECGYIEHYNAMMK